MTRDDTLTAVHGLKLFLPPTWEDTSVYRFNAPPSAADETEDGLRLQPNLIITRHEQRPGDALERFLELMFQDSKQADPTLELLHEGSVMFLDQPARWQDTRFTDARTSQLVYQRRLAVATWPRHFTLLTLTGASAALDAMCAAVGLEHLGQPHGGADVGGGVTAVLVSKTGGGDTR